MSSDRIGNNSLMSQIKERN